MVIAEDLIDPIGDITPSMFPEDSPAKLSTRIDDYLAAGYVLAAALSTDALKDAAAKAWAYHRAYTVIAGRLAAQPSSATLTGLGHLSTSSAQIKFFQAAAAAALADYSVAIAITAAPPLASSTTFNYPRWF